MLAALVVVTALPWWSVAAAPVSAQGECLVPDAHQQARLLHSARTGYGKLLQENAALDCALDGLLATDAAIADAVRRFEVGRSREARGLLDEARSEYAGALAINSELDAARTALTALDAPPTPSPSPTLAPFAPAQALTDAGFYEEAATEAKKAIISTGQAPPVSLGALPGQASPLEQGLREFTESFLPSALAVGVMVLGALLLFRLVLKPLIWDRLRHDPALVIGDFGDEAATAKAGTSIAGVVRDEFDRMRNEGAGNAIRIVSGQDEPLTIPEGVGSLGAGLPLIGAISALIPPRSHTLSGTLVGSGTRGVGLAMTLSSGSGQVYSSALLWERDFDPLWKAPDPKGPADQSPYVRLAIAGAAWAAYKLKRRRLLVGDERKGLLTEDWLSFARFRVAAAWEADKDDDRSRPLYLDALGSDGNNRGALFNLAGLDWEKKGGEEGPSYAQERLERTRRLIKSAAMEEQWDVKLDRLWHRVTYNLAAYHLNRYAETAAANDDGERAKQLSAAETWAQNLVEDAASVLDHSDKELRRLGRGKPFRDFVSMVLQLGVVVAAMVASKRQVSVASASFSATPVSTAPSPAERQPARSSAPPSLSELKALPDDWATRIRPDRLLAFLGKPTDDWPGLSPAVHYALANYFAQSLPDTGAGDSPMLELAFGELERALERGSWAAAAARDPGLKPLKSADGERFRDLIKRFRPDPDEDATPRGELARLRAVGAAYAAKLASVRVTSAAVLVSRSSTVSARDELSQSVGVDSSVILQWAHLAELVSLPDVGPKSVNLLAAAGVASWSELAESSPPALANRLRVLNEVQKILDDAPSEAEVKRWIEEARGRRSRISLSQP